MALTPSQQAAVLYDRNLILFAGPGSGKTSTSVAKGRRILGTPDTRLCMVSFTTAAAAELQARMAADYRADGLQMPRDRLTTGTFHSLALRHYQRHVRHHPRLLPPPARSAMLHSMLAKHSREERGEFTLVLEKYQGAMDPTSLTLAPEQREFIEEYLRKMASAHATDLASVMRDCTLRMASGEIPLLPVTHLIGDEMQDADEVQLEFILNHTRAGVKTTLVADDDQTIYEWRCALGYAGLQHFATEAGAKTITLAENFRSRAEIVSYAGALIGHNNPARVVKDQRPVRGLGGVLGVLKSSDTATECELVAQAIAEFRADGEEIAILARSNRALDRMEQALSAGAIPYRRDGPTIWDALEIGTLVSFLKALVSSRTVDLLPVIMLLPLDGGLRRNLEGALAASCGSFLDGEIPNLSVATPQDKAMLKKFSANTSAWRKQLRAGEVNLAVPDVAIALGEMIREHGSAAAEGSGNSRRVNFLLDTAVDVLTRLEGSLSKRLATISMMQTKEAGKYSVRLMTMHGSKGLEFDTVFVINASKPDDGSTLMEDHPERRLFYVALTRAKDRFFATFSGEPLKYLLEAELPSITSFAEVLEDTPAAKES
jgi:superfamily I DNA/RNA helicase